MALIPLLCNGKEAFTDNKYDVPSPYCSENNKSLYQACCLNSSEEIESICNSAQEGFEIWSDMKYSERLTILKNCVDKLKDKRQEFIECFEKEGLPSWFVHFNADQLVSQFERYLDKVSSNEGEVIKSEMCDLAITIREPIGPVLSISPWNAPGILIGRSISAPLVAGCSVIVKSTELSPKVAYLWVKALHEGGVPVKAIQLVNIDKPDNERFVSCFIKNRNVKKIAFTGSSATGSQIAQVAGANLKPCLLELGGKNCSIIEKDADLSTAVGANLWASWGHKGQICMSTDKIYVHESRYDEFKRLLGGVATELLKDSDYFLPQRISHIADQISDLINDALANGAEILFGEQPNFCSKDDPKLVNPLVLGNITLDMLISRKETFGPVVCVYKFTDSSELVKDLNKQPYGLKTSIWTKNVIKGQKLARKIESGGVHINGPTIYDEPTAPHGGVKQSGYGRYNGSWGVEEFTYVKVITMNEK